ncbi:MAG: hypothetical protein RBS80_23150 [Thermoguttaceae bacterium]|jgi:hypothetical protein|nr:hypothetical protein [Thermoguttaceae bacterium]
MITVSRRQFVVAGAMAAAGTWLPGRTAVAQNEQKQASMANCGGFRVAPVPAADEAAEPPLGLMVDDEGTLLLAGRPFMGMGIQYQNCFQRRLLDPEDTSYRQGFEELASYGIPFVRLMA